MGAATGGIKSLAGQLFDGKKGVDFSQVGKDALGGAAGSIPIVGGMLKNKITGGGAQGQTPQVPGMPQVPGAPGAGGVAGMLGQGGGQGLMNLAKGFMGMEHGGGIPHNPDLAGAPYKMRGVRLMKSGGINEYGAGGNVYAENGVKNPTPGDPPHVFDVANIRMIQDLNAEGGVPRNQYFVKKGEDQYTPLAYGQKELIDQLGEDKFLEYMRSINMVPKTDDAGNWAGGFDQMKKVNDLDPYEYQTNAFMQEYFGKAKGRGRDEMGRTGFGDQAYERNPLQIEHYKDFHEYQEPRMTSGHKVSEFDLPSMRMNQAEYLLGKLRGGQGGGQGGM